MGFNPSSNWMMTFPGGKLYMTIEFGLPESDNETYVLCIAGFDGSKTFMDSPFVSLSGTNISFNKIVNVNGVETSFELPNIQPTPSS